MVSESQVFPAMAQGFQTNSRFTSSMRHVWVDGRLQGSDLEFPADLDPMAGLRGQEPDGI